MSSEFAKDFYASTEWKKCREAYNKKQAYICEICGDIATEVHHIKHLTPDNINNPEVTLNFNNLMCLCHKCHVEEHKASHRNRRYYIDKDGKVHIKKT